MVLLANILVFGMDEPRLTREPQTHTALSGPYTKSNLRIITNNLLRSQRINGVELDELKKKNFFSQNKQKDPKEISPIVRKILYQKSAHEDDFLIQSYKENPQQFAHDFDTFVTFLQEKPTKYYTPLKSLLFGLQKIIEWDLLHPETLERNLSPHNKKRKINNEDKIA